jgi:hypothetical protein
MIRQPLQVLLFSMIAIFGSGLVRATYPSRQDPCTQDPAVWVGHTLEKMETIKPGMTREELLNVFKLEGGLSNGLHRTFVSTDCRYFKVDVDFRAVGRPDRDADGRVTLVEDKRDIIVKISQPYLQFSIVD